ncbi:hypothetical protein P3X46_005418 [Hevea brasiliensis]|uniref:N-acetyltransferase domain-containing protein n=1 Tax=Hevea brasiliensis TaxID=3981 RepID=A0ABQ9N0G7_HEVBR|nr:hypothetical protein P3X46_005418 [Hevea brasiliensis]
MVSAAFLSFVFVFTGSCFFFFASANEQKLAHMLSCYLHISKGISTESQYTCKGTRLGSGRKFIGLRGPVFSNMGWVVQCCIASSMSASSAAKQVLVEDRTFEDREEQLENLVSEFGWRVRKLVNDEYETRYAYLVAEPAVDSDSSKSQMKKLVGIVDVTASRDESVLQHLSGAEEYLMYLVLRAYEDDMGAPRLYSKAGYRVVSRDSQWITWIGRKPRVFMIKQYNLLS